MNLRNPNATVSRRTTTLVNVRSCAFWLGTPPTLCERQGCCCRTADSVDLVKRYRVEVASWAGSDEGAQALEDQLNGLAAEGWELVFMIPTVADTSIRALVGAGSAGTTEVALVLQRTGG